MLARFVHRLIGLLVVVGIALPAGPSWAAPQPEIVPPGQVIVELSVERRSPAEAIVSIVVRNNSGFDLREIWVYGTIPPGSTVVASWTGEAPDNPDGYNPGSLTADQSELTWFNPIVPQKGIQGPFRYQIQFDPAPGPSVRARATWLQPERGEASAAEVRLAEPAAPPPAADTSPDIAVASGRFYKQTNGQGPQADAGFAVVDGGQDGNGQPITFWSAFQQLGGWPVLGYPVSRRFKLSADDSFVYQLFQKGLLQWNPAERRAVLANLGDLLSSASLDSALETLGYAPAESDSSGGNYPLARQQRLDWLNTPGYQDLRDAYLAIPNAETVLGLPAAHPRSYGWIRVLRLQRGALATYNNGPVTWTSLGDDAKKLGFFGGDVVAPQTLAGSADLTPAVRGAPGAVAASGSPIPFKYREWYTEVRANCSVTVLRGTVTDRQGTGVNGLLVRSWNDEGNEFLSLTGYQLQVGQWERFIDYGIKPSRWNIQVVDPDTKAALSPVSKVSFNDQCGDGGVQEIWVHFRVN